MPQYRVKDGHTHGAQKKYKGGDVVELTVEEASGFLDKLELVEDTAPRAGGDPRKGELVVATPGSITQEDKPLDLREVFKGASDEQLLEIPGVGEKSLPALRAWARGEEVPPVEPEKEAKPADTPEQQDAPPIGNDVEKQLEAETGHDVVQTGATPPTFVETSDPAPSFDVANASVEAVLAAVKDGKITASAALIAEQQGNKKRATLIEALSKQVDEANKAQG